MKILLYSSNKKIRRKTFTDCKIANLRKQLGLNIREEIKLFNIKTEMKYIALHGAKI